MSLSGSNRNQGDENNRRETRNRNGNTAYAITTTDSILSYKNGLHATNSSPSTSSTSPSSIHSMKENFRITSPSSLSSSSVATSSTIRITTNGDTGNITSMAKYTSGGSSSPLYSHRIQQSYSDINTTATTSEAKTTSNSSSYQIPSTSSINLYTTSGKIKSNLDESIHQQSITGICTSSSNNIILRKISSPSKTIIDNTSLYTNTLPLSLGRNNNNSNSLYQSEGTSVTSSTGNTAGTNSSKKYDFHLSEQKNSSAYTSPGVTGISYNFGNNPSSSSASHSPYSSTSSICSSHLPSMGVYATLPKLSGSYTFSTPDYSISFSPSASQPTQHLTQHSNGSGNNMTSSSSNYRMQQYTSPNPFLNPFLNPPSDDSNGDQCTSSSTSTAIRQLDEEDLK